MMQFAFDIIEDTSRPYMVSNPHSECQAMGQNGSL